MWIDEHPEWPDFHWNNDDISTLLADVRHRQGRLLDKMESMGFELRQEANLEILTRDVVKTSAIEGEYLDAGQVIIGRTARHGSGRIAQSIKGC